MSQVSFEESGMRFGPFPEDCCFGIEIKDSLANALHPTLKTWALAPPAVVVLNNGMARRYGLIHE